MTFILPVNKSFASIFTVSALCLFSSSVKAGCHVEHTQRVSMVLPDIIISQDTDIGGILAEKTVNLNTPIPNTSYHVKEMESSWRLQNCRVKV
ncbi:hypothetical protein LA316_05215 [Enterobacter bugandensis]|uniref:hypothetical protein n=1 Tax=Enterobacter bugandensis TaxID=881260 RepID=UPI001CCF5B9F|nr:hypothetical protein [Enterobacter bugandensis]UBH41100.1 hypothetical protein LA316_05215 [Enterobacter bugandensis]